MSSEADGPWAKVRWRDRAYDVYVPNADTDYIQGRLLNEGAPYEEGLLTEFSERLSPGDLALDIGANVGNHALFMACALGCKVEAFEPDGHLVRAIEVSLERNDVQHLVRTHRTAVGATHSAGKLVCDDPTNLGGQRVVARSDAPTDDDGAPIEIVALDEISLDQPVRLVKIDVEGAELDVLSGAASLLERDRPLVYVECLTDTDFVSVEAWLGDRGYVWVGVWNASPTHCFVHGQQLGAFADLRGRMRDVALSLYALTGRMTAIQQRLDRANLMYRMLAHKAGDERAGAPAEIDVVLSNAEGLRLQFEQLARDLAATRNDLIRRLDTRDSRSAWAEEDLRLRLQETAASLGSTLGELEQERVRASDLLTRLAAAEQLAAELEQRAVDAEDDKAHLMRKIEGLQAEVASGHERHLRVRRDLKVVRRHIEEQDEKSHQLLAASEQRAREVDAERSRHEDALARLLDDLDVERSRHRESESRLSEQLRAERARHASGQAHALEDLNAEKARHEDVEAGLRGELRIARNQRDTYRGTLIQVRNSATYIVGAAFRDAIRSPKGLARLFAELRRAYRAAKESKP